MLKDLIGRKYPNMHQHGLDLPLDATRKATCLNMSNVSDQSAKSSIKGKSKQGLSLDNKP